MKYLSFIILLRNSSNFISYSLLISLFGIISSSFFSSVRLWKFFVSSIFISFSILLLFLSFNFIIFFSEDCLTNPEFSFLIEEALVALLSIVWEWGLNGVIEFVLFGFSLFSWNISINFLIFDTIFFFIIFLPFNAISTNSIKKWISELRLNCPLSFCKGNVFIIKGLISLFHVSINSL